MANPPCIIWFRKDLRLDDNSALVAAIQSGAPVIPVFIWAPEEHGAWAPGAASKWWLHYALESLGRRLEALGSKLILRQGQSLGVLNDIIEETGACRVVWNRRYEEPLRSLDASIKRSLKDRGVEVESFNSSLLNEPHTVSTGAGKAYKVYTPYWKKVKDRTVEPPATIQMIQDGFYQDAVNSLSLDSLELLPRLSWGDKLAAFWEPSEEAAQKRLTKFLEDRVETYHEDRDLPTCEGTSALSPYLHWGQIGPRQVMTTLKSTCDLRAKGPRIFAKEIYWREFAYNVLYHFPHTPDEPLQEKYSDFPWESDSDLLKRWQTGKTGYPIVDAGMRQLYETGWMHNRVRMIVSSLLVKHLLQDWKEGAKWFWDTLVDADLASNTLGWQWSGGCGADAAPYFRIFNPITQGQKFDPEGAYVRRWVPEIAKLPNKYIHEPWEAPDGILQHAGVRLGEDYPEPVIEHKAGRERALAALASLKDESSD